MKKLVKNIVEKTVRKDINQACMWWMYEKKPPKKAIEKYRRN